MSDNSFAPFELREALAPDVDELVALFSLSGPEMRRAAGANSKADPAAIRLTVASDSTFVAVCRDAIDGKLVGSMSLITCPSFGGTRGWVEDLLVHPDFRGKGLGTKLFTYVLEAAHQRGIAKLQGSVNPRRVESHHIHQKLGFEVSESVLYKMRLNA